MVLACIIEQKETKVSFRNLPSFGSSHSLRGIEPERTNKKGPKGP